MATYNLMIPIVGYAVIEVEADSEAEAKETAFNQIELEHIEQWESVEQIVEGNVFHGSLNRIEIELIED